MLSMMGRIQLSILLLEVLRNSLSMSINGLPCWLKIWRKNIWNFIWTDCRETRALVTAKWDNICKHKKEGGLGVINLKMNNLAAIMKLAWDFHYSKEIWVDFMSKDFSIRRRWFLPSIMLQRYGQVLSPFWMALMIKLGGF